MRDNDVTQTFTYDCSYQDSISEQDQDLVLDVLFRLVGECRGGGGAELDRDFRTKTIAALCYPKDFGIAEKGSVFKRRGGGMDYIDPDRLT